jgi:hypothetical protein
MEHKMGDHESHSTRFSDASSFDSICVYCGATDAHGDRRLEQPCPGEPLSGVAALERELPSGVTVRKFLRDCLVALVEEGESFSGKRPLGNSDWNDELCVALGCVTAEDEYDYDKMRRIMRRAIAALA